MHNGRQKQRLPPPPPPPPKPPFSASTTTTMDAKQIIDTLPSYISLYKNSSLNPNPNPNPDRSAILRWFGTLSPPQRAAHLTVVDHPFAQLLLRMISLLRRGHVTFIALPDLPSRDSPSLPSLCHRRSRGLLARVAESSESARLIRSSFRLFSSKEGEDGARGCQCDAVCLDTVTFEEGFVADLRGFVEAMDRVSDSGFLNGSDWGELGSDWVELGWLKAKGYYSMEAFVANRVEVALRLAWLNCNGGKKRGVKLKEKAKASNAAGVGANVYWRKRGCVEWWQRLDAKVKRKAFRMILGRAAESLVLPP